MSDPGGRPRAHRIQPDTVVALFESQADAEQAIRDLRDAGFPKDAMGVVLRDPGYGRGSRRANESGPPRAETVPAGALGGGIVGGVVGLVAGASALALPRIGPVIAGGALASSLTGAGLGAAAGGVLGALVGLGVPEGTARYFEEGVRQGSVMVTVDAGKRQEAARDILRFSKGDLGGRLAGMAPDERGIEEEPWRGNERRYRDDPAYPGPERRIDHHRGFMHT